MRRPPPSLASSSSLSAARISSERPRPTPHSTTSRHTRGHPEKLAPVNNIPDVPAVQLMEALVDLGVMGRCNRLEIFHSNCSLSNLPGQKSSERQLVTPMANVLI
jgi:hypothetical protein